MSQDTELAVLRRDNFKCRKCGARCPEHLLVVDKVFKDSETMEPGDLATYCEACHNEYFTDAPIIEPAERPFERTRQFVWLLESLKDQGLFRKDIADEICRYFGDKLCGNAIGGQTRQDIERSLRDMDAVDVLGILEDAYYCKIRIVDGTVSQESFIAFIEAIPEYLYTARLGEVNRQLRIIRGSCATHLADFDYVECYRYLKEYTMSLEGSGYAESDIMHDLIENVSQFDRMSRTFDEWKAIVDRHKAQMLTSASILPQD